MNVYDSALEKFRRSRPTRPKSTWDDDITPEFINSLTSAEKAAFFPNEYDSFGRPYGDF